MADSAIAVTPGSGVNVDTRTQSNGDHRQVICVGDQTGAQIVTVSANGELVVSQLDSAHAASYSASGAATPSGSTTGQLFTIMGSASKLIRVTFVEVSLVATTAAATSRQLSKLSTATTGTASAMTAVPHDSNDAAATASVNVQV